jgi:glycosyltransferase involved in cell wall biosynthesis
VEAFELATQDAPKELTRALAQTLPEELHDYYPVAKHIHVPDIPEGKPSVAIHVGLAGFSVPSYWGPENLTTTGLGGSEEAVVRLAPLLAERGMHVEVYGPWTTPRVEDGVHYIEAECWDPNRELDTFIAWRYPKLLAGVTGAKKRVVWLHDVMKEGDFKGLEPAIDEVWCLSQFHEDVIKKVWPYAPVWRTANGIRDMASFLEEEGETREPNRFLYASSPDRGLVPLLEWWPDIKARVPDATLHIYYGFTQGWYRFEATRPELRAIRQFVENKLPQLEGVTWHGFVDQDTLDAESAKCAGWLYPTLYPEISCITAMKMQALGVTPVVFTGASAIAETTRSGLKLGDVTAETMHEYKDAFVDGVSAVAEGTVEAPDAVRFNQEFSWGHVANQWVKHLQEHVCLTSTV